MWDFFFFGTKKICVGNEMGIGLILVLFFYLKKHNYSSFASCVNMNRDWARSRSRAYRDSVTTLFFFFKELEKT